MSYIHKVKRWSKKAVRVENRLIGEMFYIDLVKKKESEWIKYLIKKGLFKVYQHNPKKLVELLSNFTKDTPIKYTTHIWDFGDIKSEYGGFDGFLGDIKKQFNEMEDELKGLSFNLHKKIYTFLIEKDIKESWSKKDEIKVGWSSINGLKEWCDNGKNPFEYKLPKTQRIENKTIRTFKDVVELFKKEIEVRGESMLEDLFLRQQKKLGKNFEISLKKLKGRNFYTDVEIFENVLDRIFDSIKTRERYKRVTVEVREPNHKQIEIRIIHHNSFAQKNAKELLDEAEDGDFEILKKNLTNLCDWSVESSYENKGFRINYLQESAGEKIEYLDNNPLGFTYILKFYKK